MDILAVSAAALLAGFVDSIVGGGGLVMVPAMFAIFPLATPATLLGTNKIAGSVGTAFAAWKYTSRVNLRWSSLSGAAAGGFSGACAGAWAASAFSQQAFRLLLPVLLLGVFLYTAAKKELGHNHSPRFAANVELRVACCSCLPIGFYDGFFGPGGGSLLIFFFVRALGYDFLHASASAKVVNSATNLAAVIIFSAKGHVWWHVAGWLVLANIIGTVVGISVALRYGAGFVRRLYLGVVGALILKSAYDAYGI
ncbi:sulfite exporter TauE/SafE family protein [Acidovorax sp. sic0104]|uniref:sulfite exporter TauE/SafE family protein n=1 Tax=Acidovorax sp. sic0104 TaxID=2854784 RepID=UPI001C470BC5|nr:sulfite exporter TauE/SafE family protein [Acidovorax sp. sic0104]MBV7543057.1 sulfite exporter TauE/SafE family protein [Acidovorax sp. sic0104]